MDKTHKNLILGAAGLAIVAGIVHYVSRGQASKNRTVNALMVTGNYTPQMRAESQYTSASFIAGTEVQPNSYNFPDTNIYDSWELGENGGNAMVYSGGNNNPGLVVPDTRAAKFAESWKLRAVAGSHL